MQQKIKFSIVFFLFWAAFLSSCKKENVSEPVIPPFQPKVTEYVLDSLNWSTEPGLRFINFTRPGQSAYYSFPIDTFSHNHFIQVLIKFKDSVDWKTLNYSYRDSTGQNSYDVYYTVLSTKFYFFAINRIVIFSKENAVINFSKPVSVKVIKIG